MAGTFSNLLYHMVFSTKLRYPLIASSFEDELYRYIGGIVRGQGGIGLQVNGMPDHIHILAKLKPTPSVADMLRMIKSNSSKWANDEKMELRKFGWQQGYAVFSVSESQVDHVRDYIRRQKEHHKTMDFKTELRMLLDKHGVEYDERYLWD